MCGVSVNGAMPTHCAPSPPMCVRPMVRRSVHAQRHAVTADAGAGHRALGHDGRAVVRAARAEVRPGAPASARAGPLAQRLEQRHARGDRSAICSLPLEARGHDLGDAVGVELAVGRHERAALLVALADDARALGVVVERRRAGTSRRTSASPRRRGSPPGPARTGARSPAPSGTSCRSCRRRMPWRRERRVVQAELAQRLAQVVVRLAGGDDARATRSGGVERRCG